VGNFIWQSQFSVGIRREIKVIQSKVTNPSKGHQSYPVWAIGVPSSKWHKS